MVATERADQKKRESTQRKGIARDSSSSKTVLFVDEPDQNNRSHKVKKLYLEETIITLEKEGAR